MGEHTTARAFPLQWPEGWKRTAQYQRRRSNYKVTPDRATKEMLHSLELLGARRVSIVISSNIPVTRDGTPYAQHRTPDDPGVAIYWTTAAHGERVIACDKWDLVHANIRAIGLALEGLRAMDRAGATQILERAFSAFGALPAASVVPVTRPWWEVLEFPEGLIGALSVAVVEARYRELAVKYHPDKIGTGSVEAMTELNLARDQAKAHYAAGVDP